MTHPTNSEINALLRISFLAFVEKVFETLHPGQTMEDKWHIEAICYELMRVANGENLRLMLNLPPRGLKSIITSVAWPAFVLGHYPATQIFVVSHNLDLATNLSNKFRKVVEADWYKDAFSTMSGKPLKDNERIFVTQSGGFREAISVHGAVIGKGADIIIMDDLLDASELATQTGCEKVNNWIDTSLSTRLNHPVESKMVLLMQRLSVFDPSAHLASQEPWHQLALPAIAEEDIVVRLNANKTYHYAKGELLDAVRLPQAVLDIQRSKLGEANFLAQYQQRPVPDGGGEIDIGLFKRYQTLPKLYDVRFLSVDAASGSQSGSYCVIQTWQMMDGNLYLVHSQRGYWNFPQLKKKVVDSQSYWQADFIAIEKASSGIALLEVLREYYPEAIRQKLLQGIKVDTKQSKVDRAGKAMVAAEQGLVHLPKVAPWLDELLPEFGAFPAGRNDDQVDAFSQAVHFFRILLRSRYNPNFKGGGRVLTKRYHGRLPH
ncbi:MAG: phage terminase large subunit [Paracoccaceae bacterium]|nr:phage terminase large subunit [Paracoccaceae bacterium]